MTTKRTTNVTRRRQITPETVTAFRNRDTLELHRLLGLKPWEPSPLRPASARDGWPSVTDERWAEIRELRRELEDAAHADGPDAA